MAVDEGAAGITKVLRAESLPAVDEVVKLLQGEPALKLRVECKLGTGTVGASPPAAGSPAAPKAGGSRVSRLLHMVRRRETQGDWRQRCLSHVFAPREYSAHCVPG